MKSKRPTKEEALEELKYCYNTFNYCYDISFKKARFARVTLAMLEILATEDYALVCAYNESTSEIGYRLVPVLGYMMRSLDYCTDFVKSFYVKNRKFATSFSVKSYFSSESLQGLVDSVLINGLKTSNWVDGRQPALFIDRNNRSVFRWCELKDVI